MIAVKYKDLYMKDFAYEIRSNPGKVRGNLSKPEQDQTCIHSSCDFRHIPKITKFAQNVQNMPKFTIFPKCPKLSIFPIFPKYRNFPISGICSFSTGSHIFPLSSFSHIFKSSRISQIRPYSPFSVFSVSAIFSVSVSAGNAHFSCFSIFSFSHFPQFSYIPAFSPYMNSVHISHIPAFQYNEISSNSLFSSDLQFFQ